MKIMLNDIHKIDEKNTVEQPALEQLKSLGWDILVLKWMWEWVQYPEDSERKNFDEVIIESRLISSLVKINPFLKDQKDQINEVIRRIGTFSKNSLLENNKQVLELLLNNTSVWEDRTTWRNNPTVRYIDFENIENNDFLAVSQFKVRVLWTENHIYPDITLFVNGLPLVVIEAKSPKVKDPIREAIWDLMSYSEQSDNGKKWNKTLFYYNQILVATSRMQAKFGSITTNTEKHFYRWTDPFPMKLDEITTWSGSPNDQQRLIAWMFSRRNLLDILKSFVIFQTNSEGTKEIKVVWRYQQFRAVKLIVDRLKNWRNQREKWGIVWHTQWSWKSLTMMFLVREMKQDDELKKYKTVFVTDRTQLEEQLWWTSQTIGFSVKVASSIKKLKELLPWDSSDLVMAMIHKFQERDELKDGILDELNTSDKILVMTDEAHRTQYSLLKANLDRALPNAVHIGFTWTPIDKTEETFWDYIDKYTMRQAIDDGVTLEIVYEWRTHSADVNDKEWMNQMFHDVFKDYTAKEKIEILWYATRKAYLEAEETIKAKAIDMVEHYINFIFSNGFKAQIVANSREAAKRYKWFIEEAINHKIESLEKHNPYEIDVELLKKLKVWVVISPSKWDNAEMQRYTNESEHKKIIDSFKLSFNSKDDNWVSWDYGIVIVNNMLLTWFDAPIEQVMYLDQKIVAHNLLQAITRVNRVWKDSKDKWFIVDYIGIWHHLKEALWNYDEREMKEITWCIWNDTQEINNLIEAIKKIKELVEKNWIDDIEDMDSLYDLFYDENIRYDFIEAYRKLTKAFNIVLPNKEALNYIKDYNKFTEIYVMAWQHFNDSRMSMKWIPEKLRWITDKYLESKWISQKIKPISILDTDFHKWVENHKSAKTKASWIEHAIRSFIEERLDEDEELYRSFAEALEQILQENKNNWEEIYNQLKSLMKDIKEATENAVSYWLHPKKQMPVFRILWKELYWKNKEFSEDEVSMLVNLTQELTLILEREMSISWFWNKPASKNRLMWEIQDLLIGEKYLKAIPTIFSKREDIKARLMEFAQKNNDVILYAK